MKTVQMTLDEELLHSVDQLARELKTTRSAFARFALQKAIDNYQVLRQEEKHRKGYESYPVADEEFDVWEEEQEWGDS